ncbi:hypothetical protein AKG98_3547 [Moritella sp. JT01]|uniref:hypothetical protein n=1 Tax=unclassified Moritella TaxID=2637987 RepID=UPI00079BDB87|nr:MULTISPECIES: hypothetical protein [unclassified Moritella]KXO13320.1 hypothetical protein AKG98_3547 [Moritella sp. JT01]QUM80200.1 hypothetical protein HWV01_07840 [Moritella sp. 5]QUM84418.1 hypothetical protein HWV02_07825 [Moritella sp. 28]QUM88714.1 hypothetical protein HWV03_07825 [Moritella sp. 36]
MKVVVEFIETGRYKDRAWEPSFYTVKGNLRSVSPSYAVQLINQFKAILYTNENGSVVFKN